jgi:aspartate racemase
MRKNNVVQYLVSGHLGTTSVVLDENGVGVGGSRHYPYGEERWSSGALPVPSGIGTGDSIMGQKDYRRIGILGGMSPESTVAYYEYITRSYTERFGDYSYPEILIYSVSFQPYVDWPNAERWDLVAQGLSDAAQRLVAAGADLILIATNTMHIVFDQVQASVEVPMLSLLDAVADAIVGKGLTTVGLLGTRFTMEKTFYQESLARRGIAVLVPDAGDREYVNRVIYEELVAGQIRDESRNRYLAIVETLVGRGAEGIILGCTEIPLLLGEGDASIPLFDTTAIHAEAALQFSLGG